MKKFAQFILIPLLILSLFTSCGKDDESAETTKSALDSKAKTVTVATTKATASTEVNKESTSSSSTTKSSTTTKKTSSKSTTKKVARTAKPTTKPAATVAPTTAATTKAPNPYGYKNAWGTIEQMEADCAARVATKNNFAYEPKLYVGYGAWSAPGRDCYGAPSASAFKAKIFEDIDALCREYYNECGYDTIRAVFLTKTNYTDQTRVSTEYQQKIGSYLMYDDEIMVIYVQGNTYYSF